MESLPENKAARLLEIYARLIRGDVLSKMELGTQYRISKRSIQRDMEALRAFIANQNLGQDVVYDYKHRGYRLIQTNPRGLGNSEILAVCKILLESRSLRKDEMLPILDKLVDCAVPEPNKKLIGELIANETFHYIQPHHNKLVLDNLWALGEAVRHQQVVEIEYTRLKDHELVKRRVQPVGIMFSEYYFYLTAFLETSPISRILTTSFPPSTALTGSPPSKYWKNISACPTGTDLKKASSASGCSSCTAADCSTSNSDTPAPPLRPCWTACPPPASWTRTARAGRWKLRCLGRGSRCG